MRIDELEKRVQDLGRLYNVDLRLRKGMNYIFLDKCDFETCHVLVLVGTKQTYIINTDMFHFINLPDGLKNELIEILSEFAKTPIDERKEEKKYQYQLKDKYSWIPEEESNMWHFLNVKLNGCSNEYILLSSDNSPYYKNKFTDKEIKEVAEKYNIDLNMFDKIEVEDE